MDDLREISSVVSGQPMATPTPYDGFKPIVIGGDEAASAMATVHVYGNRRWLGWYNSPEWFQNSKHYGLLSRTRSLDALVSGVHTNPAILFELDGWNSPKFRAAHSGTIIEEDGYQAALARMRESGFRKVVYGRKNQAVNGSRPLLPSSVPVYNVSDPHRTPSLPLSSGPIPPSKCRPASHPYQVPPWRFSPSHPIPGSLPVAYPSCLSLHNPGQPLPPCPVSPTSSSVHPLSRPSPSSPSVSLPVPGGPRWTPTPIKSDFQLPPPVTANCSTSHSKEWVGGEQSVAPPLVALIGGLVAVSSSQPRAVLLFICAGTVILATYFVSPPRSNEGTRIVSAFLRKLHDILVAIGCSLIVLGIGLAFPKETALIPLFAFISFAGLATLFRMVFAPWITATLFGAAILSLVPFVVLTFMV